MATRQPVVRALFLAGYNLDTTKTTLVVRHGAATDTLTAASTPAGTVVQRGLVRHNRGLLEWEFDSTHALAIGQGAGDSAQVKVMACDITSRCTTDSLWVVLPNDGKPVLGFSGQPLGSWGGGFGAGFGPGLGLSGAEVETGFATIPYYSMGAARSVGLAYSTRQSYPRALVPIDLTLPAVQAGDQVRLVLLDGATRLDSLTLTAASCTTPSTGVPGCRVVLQGDFSATPLAPAIQRKWLKVEATRSGTGGVRQALDSTEVVLVDRRQSAYGSGWWPAIASQLVQAGEDRILVGATGTATIFRGRGDSLYIAPPGTFATLYKTPTGFALRARGSKDSVVFANADATTARYARSVDAFGNATTATYDAGRLLTVTDPLGKQITLGYDGNLRLATLTDAGGRQTRVQIDVATNQLVYDSLASPASAPAVRRYAYQTFGGANTVLLTRSIGLIGDTTAVVYDSTFRRRPVQARLPTVRNPAGRDTTPELAYTAYERRGYGAPVALDSTYVEMRDPRGNWTRSLLNRWRQAVTTWDALGLIGQAGYSPDGAALWSQGKNGDSSRVYHDYDAARHLVRTWITRGGDVLRLDSLGYDASHRVVYHVDSRGEITRTGYDARGNVVLTVDRNSDSTWIWYRSDGLPDSTWHQGHTRASRVVYESTWKNDSLAIDPSGDTVAVSTYDGYGRRTAVSRKQPVVMSGTTLQYQWRLSETFYDIANRVDSSRTRRTDNCPAPCSGAPTWPAALDTLRTMRVGRRFDRAGRDSLRLNDRGIATLYLYDRLGRLLSRRPWTDSMAVKDSTVYDVVGNVKKQITRRGHVITSDYDSRNRDTLTVIPGVGTLRKRYSGPQDQLSRMWYDAPIDSIGGINGEMRWSYDSRGRLMADTSYTGTIPRVTTYTYDAFERPRTTTDAVGTWTVGYENRRSLPDTLITPLADTVVYAFDSHGRAVGPAIYSGGLRHGVSLGWNANETLDSVSTLTYAAGGTYLAGRYDRSAADTTDLALAPVWTEQHGSGAVAKTLADSVVYDGWGRLTKWIGLLDGTVADTASYQFDRAGNVSQYNGQGIYDRVTDRLTKRQEATGGRTFVYDRAGNLTSFTAPGGGTTRSFTYDALNRMASVRRNGVLVARYAYDVLGRRIAKRVYSTVNGGTLGYSRFVYHRDHVAFETDSAGTLGFRYTWGTGTDDLLAVRAPDGQHYYVVQDKLGGVRGLVKRDGTWVMSQRFNPNGSRSARDSSGAVPDLRYGWVGRERDDETQLYYMRGRYYRPDFRRFIQEDPAGYAGSANLYAYVDGWLLEATDPNGTAKYVVRESYEQRMNSAVGAGGGFRFGQNMYGDLGFSGVTSFQAFADYTWGRQRYIASAEQNGIHPDDAIQQYRAVTYAADYQLNSGEARRVWEDLNYFGRVGAYSDADQNAPASSTCSKQYQCPDGDTRLGVKFNVAGKYTLNESIGNLGYDTAHELFHVILRVNGVPYRAVYPREDEAEELAANRYAARVTGADSPPKGYGVTSTQRRVPVVTYPYLPR